MKNLYYFFGDDAELLQKRLELLKQERPNSQWLRYDTAIDTLSVGVLTTEYYTNELFTKKDIMVIRNADKDEVVTDFVEEIIRNPLPDNTLVLIGATHNRTTRLGKLVAKHFQVGEFSIPEITPFALLDAISDKNASRALLQCERLFDAGYVPLAVFSLILGHFTALEQVIGRLPSPADVIARKTNQHIFKVKRCMSAAKYWNLQEIRDAFSQLKHTSTLLRSWTFNEAMLIEMLLINLCHK